MAHERFVVLTQLLEERRREILADLQRKIRDVRGQQRTVGGRGVLDEAETSAVDIQDDIELALIQMQRETLRKIDDALVRLEEGTFGNCIECGEPIAQPRLRALMFAERCKECEEAHEVGERRIQQLAQRRTAGVLFDVN